MLFHTLQFSLDLIQDVLAYEAAKVEGNSAPPPGWDTTVKRAAAALNLLASNASKPEVQKTLSTLRDELRALIQPQERQ